MSRSHCIKLFVGALALITLSAPPLIFADEAKTMITVEAQPLATALQDFSEQSGLQIAYVATLAENVTSPGTNG